MGPARADEIERLIDEYLELSAGAENARRLRHWLPEICARDQWHGRPRPELFRREGTVPVQIDLQNTFLTQIEPHDLRECYTEPVAYLRFFLRKRIFAYRNLADDTPLDGVVPIYLSTPFEMSFFGVPHHLYADREPLIDQTRPVVRNRDDLERLPAIDFRSSGMMPVAHRLYEGVCELAGARLKVVFPEWLRGPFGVALYLRGYQDFLVDMIGDPEFAQALLVRINQARIDWCRARGTYLGMPVGGGSLFDDEVDAAVIGARHYREHIRPHEAALADFHGEITYWHSCGNTAPMARDVTGIGRIGLLDVSGWTDLERVLDGIDARNQILEVRFNPVKDVQEAGDEDMAECIRRKVACCRRHDVSAFTLRVSGIQPWRNPVDDLDHLRRWIGCARAEVERADGQLAASTGP